MTGDEFDSTLASFNLDRPTFAAITGQHPSTVYGWGGMRNIGGTRRLQDVPRWVPVLFDAWRMGRRALARAIKARIP